MRCRDRGFPRIRQSGSPSCGNPHAHAAIRAVVCAVDCGVVKNKQPNRCGCNSCGEPAGYCNYYCKDSCKCPCAASIERRIRVEVDVNFRRVMNPKNSAVRRSANILRPACIAKGSAHSRITRAVCCYCARNSRDNTIHRDSGRTYIPINCDSEDLYAALLREGIYERNEHGAYKKSYSNQSGKCKDFQRSR